MADNYFGITDTGKQRSNNEDTFIVEMVMNGRYIAACVIDGVGGYDGGEVAASLAHDAILQHLEHADSNDLQNVLREAIALANEAIYNEKQTGKGLEQMACVLTLVLADVERNKFFYAHVGDTRLYLLRDKSLVKVTQDHSFVGFLEDSGRLSEEEAMRHPKRNEINKALGFDAQIRTQDYIEIGKSPFLPGDMLLLCSDGLTDMVNNKRMTTIAVGNKSLQTKGKELIQAANEAGGKDNITVVLVTNSKTPVKQQVTKPVSSVNPSTPTATMPTINTVTTGAPVKKKRSAVPLLASLCIVLLLAVIWLFYRDYEKQQTRNYQLQDVVENKARGTQEQALADSIQTAKQELFVLNYPDTPPTVITDSIVVRQNSLHIIGNGITFYGDTSYAGAALIMSATCKYLLLDSMTFQNFNVAVLANNSGLHLKNVRFVNCAVPVQVNMLLQGNTSINGSLPDSVFGNY